MSQTDHVDRSLQRYGWSICIESTCKSCMHERDVDGHRHVHTAQMQHPSLCSYHARFLLQFPKQVTVARRHCGSGGVGSKRCSCIRIMATSQHHQHTRTTSMIQTLSRRLCVMTALALSASHGARAEVPCLDLPGCGPYYAWLAANFLAVRDLKPTASTRYALHASSQICLCVCVCVSVCVCVWLSVYTYSPRTEHIILFIVR